jgi:hypothetical protein
MASARPLRDVFADLAGEHAPATNPADVLAANGHPGLPEGLVAEAVVNYADTAPIEVAQHLSTFVMANSPVPLGPEVGEEPLSWLHALTTAPVVTDDPLDAGLDSHHGDLGHLPAGHTELGHVDPGHMDPGLDLDFGGGEAHPHDPYALADPHAHDPYAVHLDQVDERHDLAEGHESGLADEPTPEYPLSHEVFDPHHPHDGPTDDGGAGDDPGHHHH